MKRVLIGLLLLSAIGALGCRSESSNNNATPNANASPGSSPTVGNGNTNTKGNDPINFGERLVTIIIEDGPDKKPFISSVMPDPANLWPEPADPLGALKVQWLVDNRSTSAEAQNATVEIKSFKGKANPSDTKPFGPDPNKNEFILTKIPEGQQRRMISEKADFQPGETAYTYEVTLKTADGTLLGKYKRMPEIIVGGMTVKPGASPAGTPKPNPTTKPKTYGLFLRGFTGLGK